MIAKQLNVNIKHIKTIQKQLSRYRARSVENDNYN